MAGPEPSGVRRRTLLGVVAGLWSAGCASAGDDPAYLGAFETFNSAVELREEAHTAEAAAQRAWAEEAWREAEDRFNRARSGFERAAGRFSEAGVESEGCPRLGRWADESFGYCLRLERACTAWMRAADARRRGRRDRAADHRAEGTDWASRAGSYPRRPAADPDSFDCRS